MPKSSASTTYRPRPSGCAAEPSSVLYTVVLDANVLVPYALTDLLLRLAEQQFFRPLWSEEILAEVSRTIRGLRPDIDLTRISHRLHTMNAAFDDACVRGWAPLVAGLELPDTRDRHVHRRGHPRRRRRDRHRESARLPGGRPRRPRPGGDPPRRLPPRPTRPQPRSCPRRPRPPSGRASQAGHGPRRPPQRAHPLRRPRVRHRGPTPPRRLTNPPLGHSCPRPRRAAEHRSEPVTSAIVLCSATRIWRSRRESRRYTGWRPARTPGTVRTTNGPTPFTLTRRERIPWSAGAQAHPGRLCY